MRVGLVFVIAGSMLGFAGQSCSFLNREGPEVTCADLNCGITNDCQDGIIASCFAGKLVEFTVCAHDDVDKINASDICEAEWQVPGRYRCAQASPQCLGCEEEATCE